MGNSMGSVDMDLLVHTLEKMEFDQKTARHNQLNVSTIVGRSINMQLAASAGVSSWGHAVVEQEKSNLDAALRGPPVLMSNCDRQYMDPSTNFAEAVDNALETDLCRLASNQKVAIKKALKRLVKAGALTQVGGQYKLVSKGKKAGISKQRRKSLRTATKRTSGTPLRAPATPWNPVGAFDVSTVPPTPPPAPKLSTLDQQMADCASLTDMTRDSPLTSSESKLQARGTKAFMRMMQAQQTLHEIDQHADDRVAPVAEFQLIEEEPEPMLETQPLTESIHINISCAQLVETVTGADEVAPAMIERVDMSFLEAPPSQPEESDKQLIGVLERMDRAAAAKERMKSAKRQLAMFAKTPMKLGTEFVMMKDAAEVIKACVPERVLSPSVHAMNVA